MYTFPHRTIQEYLAACYLTAQEEYPGNIATLVRQEPNRWREVVLLAGAKAARGHVSSIWGLADALCYQDIAHAETPTQEAWGALLAGQTLIDVIEPDKLAHPTLPANRQKVERIGDWLSAILTETQPPDNPFPAVERALAGNILAQLGDPRPGVGVREDGLPDIVWCDVPAGTFLMGDARKSVQVAAFQISRYPVSNAQYRAFIKDGGYTQKACWTDDGWAWKEQKQITEPKWAGGDFDLANHPVVRVSWYEAMAFCCWLTMRLREREKLTANQEIRLPTETEWEKAARTEDGRIYPWGDEIDSEHANYEKTGLGVTSTVGCFPRGASPYGCEDLAGNVWEWCQDAVISGSDRVLRGGSWYGTAECCRTAFRDLNAPDYRVNNVGFRLVRTPA